MRRSQSLRVCGLLGRLGGLALILAALIPCVWLVWGIYFLRCSPTIIRDAWQDWRYMRHRRPGRTFLGSLKEQVAIWVESAGIR